MEAVEDDFLVPAVGSLVQTILESLRVNKMDAWIRQVGLAGDIKGLVCEIRRVNMAVSDIRSMQLAESSAALKEVLYHADDVVDELDYYRLLQQVQGVTLHEPEGMHGAAQVDGTSTSDDNILSSSQDDNILPRSGSAKKRAKAWGDYDEIRDSNGKTVKAKCKRCKKIVQYDSKQGTGVLIKHVESKSCQKIFRESDQLPSPSSIDDATENATPVAVSNSSSRMGTDQEPTHITAAIAHPWNKDGISSRIQEITRQLKNIREDVTKDLNMLGSDSGASSRYYQSTTSEPRLRTSRILQGKVYGRDEEKNSIIKLMTDGKSDSVTVLPIAGIGGIGKTALAQFVCADPHVQNQFDHIIWVWVSSSFDEIRVSREMLDVVPREKHEGLCSLDKLQHVLNTHIKSKRILLVLDDVWDDMNNDRWNLLLAPFKSNSANGNFILVTTRNLSVAKRLGTAKPVVLRALGEEHFSSLFKARAFGNENYEEHEILTNIGRKIAGKLKGNPLAAVTAGELLRVDLTVDHWRKILKDEDGKLLGPSGGIMAALKLSYDRLPYHLRQCFSYCSIFPDSYEFLDEELVGIWISQGFVKQSHPSKRLEEIGMDYLSDLVNLGYFQQVERSYFQQVERKNPYVMCDLMRDFARMVSRTECAIIDGLQCNDILPTVQHLSIVYNKDQHGNIPHSNKFEENLQNAVASVVTKLRSLVLIGQYDSSFFQSFQDIIQKAHSLRLLKISATLADPLVCSLVNPTHIRYLKLDVTRLDRVLLSKFCHLQVLDVGPYTHFHVPNEMNYLVSLRHLVAEDRVYKSFAGIGKLTSLQELHDFSVQNSKGFEIIELQSMNELVQLGISQLQYVKTLEEAYGAGLRYKRYLQKLHLSWNDVNITMLDDEDGWEYSSKENEYDHVTSSEPEVLEGLEPHNNLKHLLISWYNGATSPTWLASNISVTSLQTLHLEKCGEWRTLPPLEMLPFLTKLKLCFMPKVVEISVPSLEEMVLIQMPKLETCSCISMRGLNSCLRVLKIKQCPALKVFDLFGNGHKFEIEQKSWLPRLCELIIHDCPLLLLPYSLPSSSTVSGISMIRVSIFPRIKGSSNKELTIGKPFFGDDRSDELSDVLFELDGKILAFHNLRFLKHLIIAGCQNLTSFSFEGLRQLRALETLGIRKCEKLLCSDVLLEHIHEDVTAANCKALPSLKSLEIRSCGIGQNWLYLVLQHVLALKELILLKCPNLKYLELHSCTALETLMVKHCESLGTLEGLQSQSLWKLDVSDCPNLKSLELYSCTALETLTVTDCESLGTLEGLQSHTLRKLEVSDCPNLKSLKLRFCTALETLVITTCESLGALEGLQSQSLQNLKLSECPNLTSLQLDSCTALETLTIIGCKWLVTLEGLQSQSLRNLEILRSPNLKPVLRSCTALENLRVTEYESLSALEGCQFQSLLTLHVCAIQNLKSLQLQLQSCTKLKMLKIEECKSLGALESLQSQSLQDLTVWNCPNLKSVQLHSCTLLKMLLVIGCELLATLEGLQSQSLQYMTVWECPNLKSVQLHSCTLLKKLMVIRCESLATLEGLQSQSLWYLEVSNCPNLKSLQLHSCSRLDVLIVTECESLSALEGLHSMSLSTLNVTGNPNLHICS